MNEVVNPPLESVAAVSTCSEPNLIGNPPRPATRPTPFTVTRVPTAPPAGVRVILGLTVNVAEEVPAVMVWDPEGDAGTRKVRVHDAPVELTVPTEVLS